MNSKILFLITLFFLASCGVKSPPVQFKDKAIDSYIGTYTGQKNSATESEEKAEQSADDKNTTTSNKK